MRLCSVRAARGIASALQASTREDNDTETLNVFVTRCVTNLGRSPDDPAIQMVEQNLQANWFDRVEDLHNLDANIALSMQIPLRLFLEMQNQLSNSPASPATPAATEPTEATEVTRRLRRLRSSPFQITSSSPDGDGSGGAARGEIKGHAQQDSESEENSVAQNGAATSRLVHAQKFRVTQRPTLSDFRLKNDACPPRVRQELDDFHRFLTVKRPCEQEPRVAKVTADKYLDITRGLYGWMHNINGVPLEGLTLRAVFPSSKRGDVEIPFQYVQWLVTERKVAATYELTNLRVMINLAKFLFDDESLTNPAEGDKPYSDIEVIRLLRQMANDAKARSKVARPVSDVKLKWLEWGEFLNLVETLRLECSPRTKTGKRRTEIAIAWSIQTYLIFSILSCVPDRQRTIRELQLGKTLQREGDNYVIVHGPEDYKTGKVYGDRPPLVIASQFTPVLEEFIQE
ncbi:hypothetical protein CYMTET_27204 [Cymbomonas tetramitiformis]|uniref:Uncharacterized protein n=1 Tax=Cymbomonas tetramitiformis TaxID=36881 RepID=A0AAE0FQY3_9CHLO|nr:hypothetical protein CYMTET_27204 [Cymbomonas tetramitiformis]